MKNLISFVLFITLNVFATEQIPDILIFEGKTYEWNTYSPANDYLKKYNFSVPEDAIQTTANIGYYLYTYTIENDSLFLTDIEILTLQDKSLIKRSVLLDFFEDESPILMNSFSKILTVPYGELVEITRRNWSEIHFSRYLVFEFKNGFVKKSYNLSYRKFLKLKRNLFSKFKKSGRYIEIKESEIENLKAFNEFRPKKFPMDSYLEFKIFELIDTIKL